MRRNDRYRGSVGVAIALTLGAACARADYVLSVVDHQTGLPQSTVEPGDSFSLDFVLSGDANDQFEAFLMFVSFSQDGLLYDWYALAEPPFVTGSVDDFSEPPDYFMAGTAVAGTYFTSGTLLELGLTVPVEFLATEVRIDAKLAPPCFDCPEVPGEPFILTVIPEPATLALLGAGGVACLRRRESRP